MNFLASKGFSLFCAVLNGAFAVNAFANGSTTFGVVCLLFCGLCTRNYLSTRSSAG